MLENLRIALRKQKKLILIFFLTIFLPALTLSVFGVRAIRNERFRLAKQEENEGRRAARFIRAHVQSKFEAIASALEGMARDPAFIGKDHAAIHDLAEKRLPPDPPPRPEAARHRAPPARRPAAGCSRSPRARPTRASS